jgi:hypothetical protein
LADLSHQGKNTLPTQNTSANAISRGDSVAILEKQKAAPKGRLFDLMLIYQHLILVAGTGFEPVTFRL